MDADSLKSKLALIDGRGYKAYRELKGRFEFPRFTLFIDRVQSDPFAAPSRMRVRVAQASARFAPLLFETKVRQVALQDWLARTFAISIARIVKGHRGTGKSGYIGVDRGGQEIIERTAAVVNEQFAEVRLAAGFPAAGRRCLGREAAAMLLEEVPRLVDATLFYGALDQLAVAAHIEAAEDQDWLRRRLPDMGLVAFVADGSILPRESGVSDKPLRRGPVIEFQSPAGLRTSIELPNRGRLAGMGVPEGVTLIVGGGYHGKSTLLRALERCVYSHVPGDGRELAATRSDAVKIRAEDGRRIEKDDISAFISNLPFGVNTSSFSTENASGSTSQAANIVEALEAGSALLLMDEDTSATNFMIRDSLMQQLVVKRKEPITPFIDQVRNLKSEHRVSTVLVMGGSGDYFDVADTVIAMENYQPRVVTGRARQIIAARQDVRNAEAPAGFGAIGRRTPLARGIDPHRAGKLKIGAKGLKNAVFGKEIIEMAALEQLVDVSQTRAIVHMIWHGLRQGYFDGQSSLAEIIDRILADVERSGLGVVSTVFSRQPASGPDGADAGGRKAASAQAVPLLPAAGEEHPGDFALPRRFEIAAALNRIRTLQVE